MSTAELLDIYRGALKRMFPTAQSMNDTEGYRASHLLWMLDQDGDDE